MEIHQDPAPVRLDEHGVLRLGATRLIYQLIIEQFKSGRTPEGILEAYPSAPLADVYAGIAYYVRHRIELDEYFKTQDEEGERIAAQMNAKPEVQELKRKIMARKAELDKIHVSSDRG